MTESDWLKKRYSTAVGNGVLSPGDRCSRRCAKVCKSDHLLQRQSAAPPVLKPPVPPTNPISVQEWQGTLDENLWPCGYGKTKYSGVTYTLDTVDDTFNYWAQQNACKTLQTTQTLCSGSIANPKVIGNVASSCGASNVEVQFIWEVGVAHSWGPQNDTTRWLFFVAHPKP